MLRRLRFELGAVRDALAWRVQWLWFWYTRHRPFYKRSGLTDAEIGGPFDRA